MDVSGGTHMRVSNGDALTVNAPASDALMAGVRGRSVSPTTSPDWVDSGKPSRIEDRMLTAVKVEQTDGVADSLLGPCTPCKIRASLCTTAYSMKTGKPLQSCGECTKKRKKCFYGDERPPIPRDRGRTKSRVKSRGPSNTGTSPAALGSLASRRGKTGATRSRSRHRSMTRAPMPSSKPSCYVLLPHLHNIQQEGIHVRMSKIEQGITSATGILESLGRQHQALAREVASRQALALPENALACRAVATSMTCNSPPAPPFSRTDSHRLDQLQGEIMLPLRPAPPAMLPSQLSTPPAYSFTNTALLPQEPEIINEDPCVIPHEIGSVSHEEPLLPDGQELGLVGSRGCAQVAVAVSLEIGDVHGEVEVAGEVGSTALIPGSANIDLTTSSCHVPETCLTISDAPDHWCPSPAGT